MAGPTKSQLEFHYRLQRLRVFQKFGLYITIIAVAALGFHCLYQCVRELAGRETTASLLLTLYAVLKAPRALAIALAYTLAGGTSTWGYLERRGKKRAIARLHPMARQAQQMFDPKKGSSKITLSGDTGPEDL
jgi:hypothetical protein